MISVHAHTRGLITIAEFKNKPRLKEAKLWASALFDLGVKEKYHKTKRNVIFIIFSQQVLSNGLLLVIIDGPKK